MGKPNEAVETYVSAAQRALARGDHAESDKQSDKALKLDSANAAALTVKARSASSQGRFADAAAFLKNLPGLDKGGEQSEFLLDLYLKSANWDEATALALKVFDGDEKNFGLAQKVAESLLESEQNDRALALVSRLRIPMLDSGEHEAVTKLLNGLAGKMPGRLEPLEWLVDSYGRTSDSFRMPDALAQLGDALVAAKQLSRAKEILEQLVDRHPESDSSKRKLNDVLRRMGLPAPEDEPEPVQETLQAEIPQPEAPKLRPEIDTAPEDRVAAAAIVEVQLDEETQRFIAQSLTDVDLFASYGLTQKAIGLLEAILRRTPNHTPTLEKLLDFVLGAGDDRRTAELAARLEEIHKERGDAAGAERFGELRRRFQRAAGLSDEEIAAAANPSAPSASVAAPSAADTELPVPVEEMAQTPVSSGVPPPPKPEPSKPVHEVDLSDEWASLLEQAAANDAPAPVPPIPSAAVANGKEIAPASQTLASAAAEEFTVSEFQIPVENPVAEQAPTEMAQVPACEETIELIPVPEGGKEELLSKPEIPATPPVTGQAAAPEEIELDQEYELILSPEPEPQQPESAPTAGAGPPKHAAPSGSQVLASDQFLADLANEIDELGIGGLTPSFSEPAAKENAPIAAAKAEAPASPAEQDHLKEVFDDFRAEIGEMGAEDEDLETHYNLGIAFREMGLLEEAISEFQKVAKANEKGKAFRYAMQCCTLLGLAFMEKGQPSIAAIWYERALRTPGVDAESTLALRYDLGVAQESANDLDAALKSFSQVYAVNIDYRGVADRIAALQKTTR
jgi:tetratricopeptide (TPR) repeat protein